VSRLRTLTAAATALVLAAVLTGCTGGSRSSEDQQVTATHNDVNPVPRAQLSPGGTLRWPLGELPPNFNANQLDGTNASTAAVISALMPGAFEFAADSTPSVDTDYYTDIRLTSSSPQAVTYDLNPRAVWSDGTPITVRDLIAQWHALNGSDPAYHPASTTGYEAITKVEQGRDDREAVVTFAHPYADWRALFSPLYPASTNDDPAVFNTGWTQQPQVTAGPFQLKSVDRTAQTITITPNPGWWGDKPLLDRIVFRVLDGDAQVDALVNGELDFIDVGPDVNKLQRAQGAPNIAIRRASGPNFRHITFNGTSPVLSDVNVRRALAKAIDRQTIAAAMIGPLGGDVHKLDNHIFMTNQPGYQDNAGDLSTPDPAAANAQLDRAGWTRQGNGIRSRNGQQLVLRLVIPSAVQVSAQEAQLVQGMLAKVGARVDIQTVPSGDFFEQYVSKGDFDLTLFSWLGTTFPISSSASIYEQPHGDAIQQNYARTGTPEIDALYQQASAELDPARAREIANRIDALIWQEVHSLTLYQRPDIVATDRRLANFGASGFASLRYQDIGFTR
jgi:peptide/nickel transport system substrate-binding protein